jgi:hypothetical protein
VSQANALRPIRIRLVIGLAIGVAVGLLYGWLVQPVEFVDTSPDSLRVDYRTDYVLMVAEVYQAEGDLAAAQRRLAALGPQPPADTVEAAIAYADDQHFASADVDRLEALAGDLELRRETPEIGGP